MAVEITRTVTSDLSGKKGAERKGFTLDGTRYAIDVTDAEWNEFLSSEVVAKFVMFARTLSTKGDDDGENGEDVKTESQLIREWAKAEGMEVGEKGRVSKAIVEKYRAAHPETVDA